MPTSVKPNNGSAIEITTELSRIDLDRVHAWLARKSYWAGEMPREVLDRAVRGSLCFAAIEGHATIGFARVISDRATFAYVFGAALGMPHKSRLPVGSAHRIVQVVLTIGQ